VKAVASGNVILPAGNVRTGEFNRLAPVNSVVRDPAELESLPIRAARGRASCSATSRRSRSGPTS
jgi:hypothetical protein